MRALRGMSHEPRKLDFMPHHPPSVSRRRRPCRAPCPTLALVAVGSRPVLALVRGHGLLAALGLVEGMRW
eukprot:2410171-Prymnesium_polylepis.1